MIYMNIVALIMEVQLINSWGWRPLAVFVKDMWLELTANS